MRHLPGLSLAVFVTIGLAAPLGAQDALELVKEGQKLLQSGDAAAAQARFERAVKADPKLFDAHYALGRVLDLRGRYEEGRQHLEEALALAAEQQKEQVTIAIAISYAFERKPDEAAKYYERVFDAQIAEKDLDAAAATANALARIYLESGNVDKAEEWYRTGYETARDDPEMKDAQVDLWEFRWQHAQARIAARRGRAEAAWRHAAEAERVLEKGNIDDQREQQPYLNGYIAFHTKDYTRAIKELQAANQRDPFILGLLGQAHEALGQKDQAAAYYRKVLASSSHNINAAFSRPKAQEFLKVP